MKYMVSFVIFIYIKGDICDWNLNNYFVICCVIVDMVFGEYFYIVDIW